MIRPPTSGIDARRHAERLAEAVVEALGDVARQLQVLALVVADRDEIGLVEQDVAGHQDRVREEAGRDELAPLRLVLELRHPAELAVARDRGEQPGRLGVRRHVALAEDGRALGVEAGREEHRGEIERRLAQLRRLVVDRDRVQVDDAEERVAGLLRRRVLAEAAAVVAERLAAGRLDAGEDAGPLVGGVVGHVAPGIRAGYEKDLPAGGLGRAGAAGRRATARCAAATKCSDELSRR